MGPCPALGAKATSWPVGAWARPAKEDPLRHRPFGACGLGTEDFRIIGAQAESENKPNFKDYLWEVLFIKVSFPFLIRQFG